MTLRPRGLLDFLASTIPVLWVGLVVGVSFIATPAKFQAGPLDGALSLAISVVTFAWLHAAEAVLAALSAVVLLALRARALLWVLFVVAVLCLILQAGWILPGFQGDPGYLPQMPVLDFGQLHAAFAVTECLKIVALFGLAFMALRGASGLHVDGASAGASSGAR